MNADPLRPALAARKIPGRPWPKTCSASTWEPPRRPTPRFRPRTCCSTSRLRRPPGGEDPRPATESPRGRLPSEKNPQRPERHESRRPERSPARPPRAERTRPAPPQPDDDFGADLDLEAPFGGAREPERESPNEEPAGARRIGRERTASSTPRARGAAGASSRVTRDARTNKPRRANRKSRLASHPLG